MYPCLYNLAINTGLLFQFQELTVHSYVIYDLYTGWSLESWRIIKFSNNSKKVNIILNNMLKLIWTSLYTVLSMFGYASELLIYFPSVNSTKHVLSEALHQTWCIRWARYTYLRSTANFTRLRVGDAAVLLDLVTPGRVKSESRWRLVSNFVQSQNEDWWSFDILKTFCCHLIGFCSSFLF